MKLMRTGCQVVIFVTVAIVVSMARTPANAQPSCEFSPSFGQACYYTLNVYCDGNPGCWTLRQITNLGQTYDEWYYIYPARQGLTQCYAGLQYYGYDQFVLINNYVACNPQILY